VLIPSENDQQRFFKALKRMNTKDRDDTLLLKKTKQQMMTNSLTNAEKTKNRIRGLKTCPFDVAKDGIIPEMQQYQLSRIL